MQVAPTLKHAKSNGFTLIELLVVIGMTLIMATMAIPIYGNLQSSTNLGETAVDVVQLLRKARTLSYTSYQDNSYGVHFDDQGRNFVLYQGSDYASRNPSYDTLVPITPGMSVERSANDFEAHFQKGTGLLAQAGYFSIRHQSVNNTKTITINRLGVVDTD